MWSDENPHRKKVCFLAASTDSHRQVSVGGLAFGLLDFGLGRGVANQDDLLIVHELFSPPSWLQFNIVANS